MPDTTTPKVPDPLNDYERGYLDGLEAYAWWKDGEMQVGTCGTTLKEAKAKFLLAQKEHRVVTGYKFRVEFVPWTGGVELALNAMGWEAGCVYEWSEQEIKDVTVKIFMSSFNVRLKHVEQGERGIDLRLCVVGGDFLPR